MSPRILGLALCFSLAFNVAFLGMWGYRRAAPPPPAQPAPVEGESPSDKMWADLGLNEEQKILIEMERQDVAERVSGILADNERERGHLLELLKAPNPDRGAIRDAHLRIGENQRQLREIAVAHMLNAMSELTPEQRTEWAERLKELGERREPSRHYAWTWGGRDRSAVGLLGKENVTVHLRQVDKGVEVDIDSADPATAASIRKLIPQYFNSVRQAGNARRWSGRERRPEQPGRTGRGQKPADGES